MTTLIETTMKQKMDNYRRDFLYPTFGEGYFEELASDENVQTEAN